MRYKSTRGGVSGLRFTDALLMGLARDGGLLVPEHIPDVQDQLAAWKNYSFVDLARKILPLYVDDIDEEILDGIIVSSYEEFDHSDVVSLKPLNDIHVLELFHGPTLAFKDIALQLLSRLFAHVLELKKKKINILGATSGDTGSAAIAGIRGKPNMDIFIMYPDQRISPLQELQMTTVSDQNVHCMAMQGSFDDCQNLMKNVFGDLEFKSEFGLSAVNSVNWARILPQIVYYGYASLKFDQPCSFSVPTGNFGNVFAAFLAKKMGFPIDKLIVGTNENDILSRFFADNTYSRGDVHFTLSPAMDIQVASNFERYLYYQSGENAELVANCMREFSSSGKRKMDGVQPTDFFLSASVKTDKMIEALRYAYTEFNYLLDPHSAIGYAAAKIFSKDLDGPLVTIATAHPAKFPDAMSEANIKPLPTHLKLESLKGLATRRDVLPVNEGHLKGYIRERASSLY